MFKQLQLLYNTSPFFQRLVQAAEGGALGAVTASLSNGFDFSKKGLLQLASAAAIGAGIAVRNLLKQATVQENK